jgi:hypothetical protein
MALLILNEEGETQAEIGTLCDGQCPACDSENDYFKRNLLQQNVIKKCAECERFAK